jgi:hypothetical protein
VEGPVKRKDKTGNSIEKNTIGGSPQSQKSEKLPRKSKSRDQKNKEKEFKAIFAPGKHNYKTLSASLSSSSFP